MSRRLSIKIYLTVLKTRLRVSILAGEFFSFLLFCAALLILLFSKTRAAGLLMRSHRNTRRLKGQLTIEAFFRRFDLLERDTVARLIPVHFRHERLYTGRLFRLKEPVGNEKGVMVIKYSEIFAKIRSRYDLEKLMKDYYLVLEPSYSGYCTPEILGFLEFTNRRIVVQAAEKMDYEFIRRLKGNLVPIDIGSSNWVDDRVFRNLNLDKEYDCIMVALWGEIKRHYLLFDALRKINDPTFRVCLLGGAWGMVRKDIENLAEYYGVRENIDFFERLKPDEVNVMLNKSKVNILLTLKEGANKSIFEGLFANVPGIVLKENIGVNKSYINENTGKLVPQNQLAEALLWFRDNYRQFNPRKWAMANISPEVSTAKLEAALKEIAAELGEPWSRPILIKVNRPECEYYNSNERLDPIDLGHYEHPSRGGDSSH